MQNYEIIIAGAGPSGSAAALQIAKLDQALTSRVLLVDKAIFPRPKLCAGAVSGDGLQVLEELGVGLNVPAVPVHVTKMFLPTGCLMYEQANHFRVVSRQQFDHSLLKSTRERGIVTREGEAVENVITRADEVIVQSSKNEYGAKILIAADGANSTIRQNLTLSRVGRLMVGMEIHALLSDTSIQDFPDNTIFLDFKPLGDDLPGYCWVFPTVTQHPAVISLGILAAPFSKRQVFSAKDIFARWLKGLGLNLRDFNLKAHPALRYELRAACSRPRVVFVGDAAGLEPLFGEGIASALGIGSMAGQVAFDALHTNDFSFSDYEKRIRSSSIGSMMRRRHMVAKRIYSNPKIAQFLLKHSTLIKGIALLNPPTLGTKITWDAAHHDS
jgi:flavin-dependent dehydrogenase